MKKTLTLLSGLLLSFPIFSADIDVNALEIPHTRYVLDNGLTLIVHEDRKAPIVAVSMWYHVGSKDEKPGRTGFAHLFEHLMFNGSENYNDEFFKPFEDVGATSMNGTTWFDRTNYFENVPTTALDMALWMESDRMGHLLGAIDQTKLDNQVGVVQNEKRQGDNSPYGKVHYHMLEGLFPEGHPYRWSTIGSMEDLSAATLDDVKAWFKQYYGAANTVLVLAGDISAEEAKQKVEHYFGDIPPGPPLHRKQHDVPIKSTSTYEVLFDTVPQRRLYRYWAVPGRTTEQNEALLLSAEILGEGKTSRLYQRLVYKEKLATDVQVDLEPHTLASQFQVVITLTDGAKEADVERVLNEEIALFTRKGPSRDELEVAQARLLARNVRDLERIGGFSGKAATLAESELYANDSSHYLTSLKRLAGLDNKSIQKTAANWLTNPYHQLIVKPFANYQVAATGADRSALPTVESMPELSFTTPTQFILDNGIEVFAVERNAIPDVRIGVIFDSGYAADAYGSPLGTAAFTMRMLEEGTKSIDGVELQTELDRLGAEFDVSSALDTSMVELGALSDNLVDSLALLTKILEQPAFRSSDIERIKTQWMARIAQEKAQPVQLALRELPPLLYGSDHPYGIPLTGSGTSESVSMITDETLRSFHRQWIRPDNAKIIVVGDASIDTLKSALNKTIGKWQASGQKQVKQTLTMPPKNKPAFYLADKPDAPQTLLLAGKVIAPSTDSSTLITDTANLIFGGKFTARLNMNLREDKGWAYGAYTFSQDLKGPRPWMVYAPVQTDKTIDAINEIKMELAAFLGDKPATQQELDTVVTSEVNQLPGLYETNASVLNSLRDSLLLERELNYPTLLQSKYDAVTLDDIQAAAKQTMTSDDLTWLVVGDADKIKADLEQLGTVIMLKVD